MLKLLGITHRYSTYFTSVNADDESITFYLPPRQGEFKLYTAEKPDGNLAFYYIADPLRLNLERELADVRVLLEDCAILPVSAVTFVLVVQELSPDETDWVRRAFEHMKNFVPEEFRERFSIEIWDEERVTLMELELGIRVNI